MAEANEEDAKHGLTPHEVPGSVFIRTGLEIEEQLWVYSLYFVSPTHPSYYRRQLSFVTKGAKSDTQKVSLQEKRNALANQIKHWRELQFLYMPSALTPSLPTCDDTTENDGEKVEDVSLILLSALEPGQRLAICKH